MCLPGTIETVRARVENEGPAEARSQGGAARRRRRAARRRCPVAPRREAADEPPAGSDPRVPGGLSGVPRRPSVLDRQVTVTIPANGFYGQTWTFWEHNCTHLDVPAHFITGGASPRDVARRARAPARRRRHLRARGRQRGRRGPRVRPRPLRARQRAHPARRGRRDELGWAARSGSVAAYRNVGADGLQHFPGFSKAAVEWLSRSGTSPASASTRSASTPAGRRRSTPTCDPRRRPVRDREPREPRPRAGAWRHRDRRPDPMGAGPGGPARVFARW